MDVLVELRTHQGHRTPARHRTVHTRVLTAAEELQVSLARFPAYSDADSLPEACSSMARRSSRDPGVLGECYADRGYPAEELTI